jgi:hypothetical protein
MDFNTRLNRNYRIERAEHLPGYSGFREWEQTGDSISGTGWTVRVREDQPVGESNAFYRVRPELGNPNQGDVPDE